MDYGSIATIEERRQGDGIMANQAQVERLMQGVTEWNQWREAHPEIQPDLSKARLSKANLRNADLRWQACAKLV